MSCDSGLFIAEMPCYVTYTDLSYSSVIVVPKGQEDSQVLAVQRVNGGA